MRDPFGFYEDLAPHGDVVRFETLLGTFTALFQPDHIERVLLTDSAHFDQVDVADFDIGIDPEGLVDVRGDQWRRQRTLMQPAFTMDRIESYADAMVEVTADISREWSDGDSIALDDAFSGLTLRILTRSLFDVDVESDDTDDIIADAATMFNAQLDIGNLSMLLPSWVPTRTNRRFKRAYRDFVERMDALIGERREHAQSNDDLLSILLDAQSEEGETLTDKELRDNMLTFMFAGHETTALGLMYTLLLLAQYPDHRDHLRSEHDRVIGDERPTFGHVPNLSATEAVIDEALRLYPPVPVMFREPTQPVTFDGYRVEPGSIVTLPQFHIHRDTRFWSAPDTFDPERWNGGNDRPEYAYFPFGGGPRHCIGMRFAKLEMQLVLAVLLRKFDFELLSRPNPDFQPGITLRPAESVRVRLRER